MASQEEIPPSNLEKGEMFVKDAWFDGQPLFASRQVAYRQVSALIPKLVEKAEGVSFTEEEREIFERVFVAMSVIDLMMDDMNIEKTKLIEFVGHANSPSVSLNQALTRIRELIEKNGNFPEYVTAVSRAISYSGGISLKDRHKEARYLANAFAAAVGRKDADREIHLRKVFGKLAAFGNYLDDISDVYKDGKDIHWLLERINAATREIKGLGKVSNSPSTYFTGAASLAMTMAARRWIFPFWNKYKHGWPQ